MDDTCFIRIFEKNLNLVGSDPELVVNIPDPGKRSGPQHRAPWHILHRVRLGPVLFPRPGADIRANTRLARQESSLCNHFQFLV
jgi:hypothetical protein